ncbi:NAD(P)H-dependent oxidoreductase [Actinomyces oricola]
MKTLVNVIHPHFEASRVNRALAAAAQEVEHVTVRHLYALYPDGVIDIEAEHVALEAADRIVLQFPMYWYSCPPLLKQWQDEALTHGWAYGSTGKALKGKELLIAVSSGSSEYGRDGAFTYTVTELLRPFQAMANLCSLTYTEPFATTGARTISEEDLAARAQEYAAALTAPRPTLELLG